MITIYLCYKYIILWSGQGRNKPGFSNSGWRFAAEAAWYTILRIRLWRRVRSRPQQQTNAWWIWLDLGGTFFSSTKVQKEREERKKRQKEKEKEERRLQLASRGCQKTGSPQASTQRQPASRLKRQTPREKKRKPTDETKKREEGERKKERKKSTWNAARAHK